MLYKEFINNILNTRGRFACGEEYHERHHIIPKCIGGTDNENNLIDLFAKEHFEAHRLLALENPNNSKLVYAWWCISFVKMNNHERYKITKDEYEELKISMHNTPRSAEHRQKLSESGKGAKHHMYGKHHTAENKLHLSANSPKNKIVFCVNTRNIYRSNMEASRNTGIHNSLISNCCLSKQKTAGGFQWKYLYDQVKKDGTIIPGAISLGIITEEEANEQLTAQN